MTDIAQLLSAVLADLDRVHERLGEVTGQLVLVEESMSTAVDTLEASRISLGALRSAVGGERR